MQLSRRRRKEVNGVVRSRTSRLSSSSTLSHCVHLGTNIAIFDKSFSLSVASVFPATKQ